MPDRIAPAPRSDSTWRSGLALLGGLLIAIAAAAGALLWLSSTRPMSLFLPIAAQALLVGGLLGWLLRTLRVQSSPAIVFIGIICGLTSAVLFGGAAYVHNVYVFRAAVHQQYAPSRFPDSTLTRSIVADADAHPFGFFDQTAIFPKTGRHGFAGYLILRGWQLWVLLATQAITIAFIAFGVGKSGADEQPVTSPGSLKGPAIV